MDGILLIDKPQGWTSHDVVAKVRSTIEKYYRENPELCACSQCKEEAKRAISGTDKVPRKSIAADDAAVAQESFRRRSAVPTGRKRRHKIQVGHSGTLDPMATGLLILLIGKATKQQDKFMKQDKTYEAEITLGATSDADDAEGKIEQTAVEQEPGRDDISKALASFTGQIEQVPPAYSAIKVGGKRSYKEARAGRKVKLEPRTVTIHDIELISYKYPVIKLKTHVSSGTYIRSLARDIGDRLGTGAYLSGLDRMSIGKYSKQNSIQVEGLDINHIKKSIIPVRPVRKKSPRGD